MSLTKGTPIAVPASLVDMGAATRSMMANALAGLADEDADLCRRLRHDDERVDDLLKEIFAWVQAEIPRNVDATKAAIDLLSIARVTAVRVRDPLPTSVKKSVQSRRGLGIHPRSMRATCSGPVRSLSLQRVEVDRDQHRVPAVPPLITSLATLLGELLGRQSPSVRPAVLGATGGCESAARLARVDVATRGWPPSGVSLHRAPSRGSGGSG